MDADQRNLSARRYRWTFFCGHTSEGGDEIADACPVCGECDLVRKEPTDDQRNLSALRLSGAELIALERERQMAREGWTPKHDDIEHQAGELAAAAVAYATAPGSRQRMKPNGDPRIPDSWPWEPEWWKPKWTPHTGREGRIRELVIAGALLAAEIDRLQRDES